MSEPKKFRSQRLECGCCGALFRTWPHYVDQDQDRGYGICAECQKLAEKKSHRELDQGFAVIRANLNAENKAIWDSLRLEEKIEFLATAIRGGYVVWKIDAFQLGD